jgi:putative acetyltransferase
VVIRSERPDDAAAVRSINEAAFGRPDEADLIDRLRAEGAVLRSLVAERAAQAVGHILFSRMWIDIPGLSVPAVALAPMAVLPDQQRQGIGARLVRAGLDHLRTKGERIVLVLGHPDYYPRFGFSAAKTQTLEHPFPPAAFMALELTADALAGIRGKVRYPVPFGIG